MTTAKIIQLCPPSSQTQGKAGQGNSRLSQAVLKAATHLAADQEPIHEAWITIVRPGGLIEQIALQ
ncbi:MAG TPA: hypothetical protein VJ576_03415 [Rhodocyclaceae bacterium]|nr:hypothetical protein [Rhodocyclaceae bacterium]